MKAEVLSGALSKRKLISRGEEGSLFLFSPFTFFCPVSRYDSWSSCSHISTGSDLRMNLIHKGGRTDSGLGHDDCGVPIISPGLPTLNPLLRKK